MSNQSRPTAAAACVSAGVLNAMPSVAPNAQTPAKIKQSPAMPNANRRRRARQTTICGEVGQ